MKCKNCGNPIEWAYDSHWIHSDTASPECELTAEPVKQEPQHPEFSEEENNE